MTWSPSPSHIYLCDLRDLCAFAVQSVCQGGFHGVPVAAEEGRGRCVAGGGGVEPPAGEHGGGGNAGAWWQCGRCRGRYALCALGRRADDGEYFRRGIL